ncbi:hypothetical protein Agub_g8609 [Astrephomene gubernaculifera]|uniref:Ankyrin repeat protein n=1 Tax=Astrephomene gubernaculifera TaxID=47775 RepID=A0AAD3DTR5_9CHLO|nr:hypothetical protein Agub_g8609 [Astrephomene gubernaculifera]
MTSYECSFGTNIQQTSKAANAGPTAAPDPGFLDLPEPILQQILVLSGSGGPAAACACSYLQTTFDAALTSPELAARFLIVRYGPSTALFHVYGPNGVARFLLRGASGGLSHDDATNKLIRELLRLGASPHAQARFLLAAAAGAGDTRTLRTILSAGGLSPGASGGGGRALVAAAAGGHLPVMQLLLRAGVSARAESGMPLRAACREGHLAAVRLLLSHGADPRVAAGAALAEAARGGHLEVVSELLATGTVDCRTPAAAAALSAAAAAGRDDVVVALLAAGVRPPATVAQPLGRSNGNGTGSIISGGGGKEAVPLRAPRRAVGRLGGNEMGAASVGFGGVGAGGGGASLPNSGGGGVHAAVRSSAQQQHHNRQQQHQQQLATCSSRIRP